MIAALAIVSGSAEAATVNGGTMLSVGDAGQLETWLGVGDHTFTNIWTGTAGTSTAASFHSAVNGVGPTFSIFGITLGNGTQAKIGGYTTADWGGPAGYTADPDAFIFNLTSGEMQQQEPTFADRALYVSATYFPTFGGGHDIFAGTGVLGTNFGTPTSNHDGSSYSHSYDHSQGQISIAGDSGVFHGDSGRPGYHWRVNSLEVYTLQSSTPVQLQGGAPTSVPLPASLPLLALGIGGLAMLRRRKSA